MLLRKPFALNDGRIDKSNKKLSNLAFKSIGEKPPAFLQLPKSHILANQYKTNLPDHRPGSSHISPAKLEPDGEGSPTKALASKLVDIIDQMGSKPETFTSHSKRSKKSYITSQSLSKSSFPTLITRSPSPSIFTQAGKIQDSTEARWVDATIEIRKEEEK